MKLEKQISVISESSVIYYKKCDCQKG